MDAFKKYLSICWFAQSPLDLPRSAKFFQQNLWFYFFLELFIQINMISFHEAVFEVILETLLTLSFAGIILLFNRGQHSYLQVCSSVLFCENVVAIFLVPTVVWLTVTNDIFSYLLAFLIVAWDYALIAFIVKKVLGINTSASCVISFLYFIYTYGGAYGATFLLFG